jgi:hypothetical protein
MSIGTGDSVTVRLLKRDPVEMKASSLMISSPAGLAVGAVWPIKEEETLAKNAATGKAVNSRH